MKLKDDDKVINATITSGKNILITTKKGYGLWYKIDSVPLVGVKASGVKSINLKDNDEVVSGVVFDDNSDYLSVFTNRGNAKRVKLSELEIGKRASRGLLIQKEIKSNPQEIVKSFVIDSKNHVGIKNDDDIKILKLTEIPIMDRYSAGSLIYKKGITDVFEETNLITKNDIKTSKKDETQKKETKNNPSLKDIDDRMMVIEDFLDDFNV